MGCDEGWPGRPQAIVALFGVLPHVGFRGGSDALNTTRVPFCPQDLPAQPILLFPLPVRSLLFRILYFKKDGIEMAGKKRVKSWKIRLIRKKVSL